MEEKTEFDHMNERIQALEAQQGDNLEVKTGMGSLKASGTLVVLAILLVAGFAAVLYQIRDHDMKNVDRAASVNKNVTDLKASIEEQTFVLTLSEKDRKDLRLDMPDSLRRKVGR